MASRTRRQFLSSSFALAALYHPFISFAESPAPPKSGRKKGYAMGTKNPQWARMVTDLNAHWIYNWIASRPSDIPAGVDWVPMIFKDDENQAAEKTLAKVSADLPNKPSALLGFNEPDGEKQANMTVELALEAWPKLQELNLPLGSPAGVHADSEWMQRFMKEALKRNYRIDFVTIHWYGGPSAAQLTSHVEKIARLYRLPVWITEFCPADWNAAKTGRNQHSEREVLRFIEDALPWLERSPLVQRYAWFGTAPGNTPTGCSALFDRDGAITKLGKAYAEIG